MKRHPFFPSMIGAALFGVVSIFLFGPAPGARGEVDPTLSLAIQATTNHEAVVNWMGLNGAPYQVQSSSNVIVWTDASLVVTGAGGPLFFTNPIAVAGQRFFRVKRLAVPEISALFEFGVLTIIGNDLDNTIAVGRDVGGAIHVNNGAVPITGGTATVLNTFLIRVYGRAGHDDLSIDHANGAMPTAQLFGEQGNDVLTGSSASDILVGGPDADVLIGRAGDDSLHGEDGDDTFVWTPGEGNDTIEGGGGHDRVQFNGSNSAEVISLSKTEGTRLLLFRDVGAVTLNAGAVEQVDIHTANASDTVVVNDLTGSDVTRVVVNFAAVIGGNTGDLQSDMVIFHGTAGLDTFDVSSDDGTVVAERSGVQVWLRGFEPGDFLSLNSTTNDVVNINGSDAADTATVTANGLMARVDVTGYSAAVEVGAGTALALQMHGGADSIACTGNLAALVSLVLDGGDGNDTILGSNGPDMIIGGDGDDFLDGQQGIDTLLGGADNDTFQWDPGDGSDVIEGQGGFDRLVFNGSGASENLALTHNAGRLRFTRDIGTVVLDLDDVERVDINALNGTDSITVSDLSATDVTQVNVDLSGTLGGVAGDALADSVVLNGTAGVDTFNFSAGAGATVATWGGLEVRVKGYEALDRFVVTGVGSDLVNVNGSEDADTISVTANGTFARVDAPGFTAAVEVNGALTLRVNGLGGADTITCVGNLAAIVPIVLDGGEGDDMILGSNGPDVIYGGDGEDFLDGQQGADTLFGGADNDTFQWDPGDGNDTIEGQAGIDTLQFNGSNGAEIMELLAVGNRLRFTRNLGSVIHDVDGVERVNCAASGSTDNIIVNNLAATTVTEVNINLAAAIGGGDAAADVVTVNGTTGPDTINVTGASGVVEVSGLAALIRISGAEVANDSLFVNGLDGADTINVSPGATALIQVVANP